MTEPAVVRFSPGRLLRYLWVVAGTIVAFDLVFMFLRYGLGHDVVFGLARFFRLDGERNVPTYFSCVLLGLAGALLALSGAHLARRREPQARKWTILGWIFVFLSLDEFAGIHEYLGRILRELMHLQRWVHFVWPIPALVLVGLLFLAYRPWFASLDPRTRRGTIVAAIVYLSGATLMELVGGAYWARVGAGTMDLTYASITAVEETLEIVGMLLFIGVLLRFTSARGWGLAVGSGSEDPERGAAPG